jgi:hypothetical protein
MTLGLDAARTMAALTIPAAIHRLDNLDDPISRAVLDLHRREPWDRYENSKHWTCMECLAGEDRDEWPCRTVITVASVHGIDLDDAWLFPRPTDGSLDQPDPAPEATA